MGGCHYWQAVRKGVDCNIKLFNIMAMLKGQYHIKQLMWFCLLLGYKKYLKMMLPNYENYDIMKLQLNQLCSLL